MLSNLERLKQLYQLPLTTLVYKAQRLHQAHHSPSVQLSVLKSIKTGRCPENCSYCPQSAHYKTAIENEELLSTPAILEDAEKAREAGATRFCMGAAWRTPPKGEAFQSVLKSVKAVKALGLEVCCTLGMLDEGQAKDLKEAGCDFYNHNLDTSKDYYKKIITTRTYEHRLATLRCVRASGMKVCCGGIVGMGESVEDRLKLIEELADLNPPPESVPINALIPIKGTPLEHVAPLDAIEFCRVVAVARVVMPKSVLRLSAGRYEMSEAAQALCFLAGANSIFLGDKLLTARNPSKAKDSELLEKLGLKPEGAEA